MPTLEEFEEEMVAKPNTALFTLILCLGTYMIAASFKDLETSHYFGKTVSPSSVNVKFCVIALQITLSDFFLNYWHWLI